MAHHTIYHGDPYNRKFFFSTGYYQEFDGEDDFVPVSSNDSVAEIQKKMANMGYEEISNPDPEFSLREV